MTDLTTRRAAGPPEPDSVPEFPDRDDRPPVGPVAALPEGVQLTRLLALVRFTAPQALEVGAGLLAEAARREDPEPLVVPDRAIVSTDGQVVLVPSSDGGRLDSLADPLADVLADVAAAARLRGRPPDPAAEQFLTELDRAATDLPDAGVPAVAARLQGTAAGIDRPAVRGELAALVRAVGERAASPTGSAPVPSPSTAGRTAPPRRGPRRETWTTVRRIGAWLLSVVVLGAAVVLEVALLRDDISADVDLLLDAGRSGAAASSTAPEPDGLPIVPPAPAAAADVAGVDLRPLGPCAPATPCSLRLLVRLLPAPDPQVVTWSYQVVDRCTGAAATVPGGTVTAPAGGQRVTAVGTVVLPDQQAVAVVAVTSLPAAAASAPVLAGSCLPDQPTG